MKRNQNAFGALLASAFVLSPVAASAQDSAQVDASVELVEAPQTFSIVGAAPLDFGQIALPVWNGADTLCIYDVDTVQADGATTSWSLDLADSEYYDAGQVSPSGCYIAGNASPARFDFTCDVQNVTFSFSASQAAARPEWSSELRTWEFIAGDPFTPYNIVKDGVSVTTSADVAIDNAPWGVDCGVEGPGDYVLYAGAKVLITATADTSSATLGAASLGTITVNATY